jgi:hypothetical protein
MVNNQINRTQWIYGCGITTQSFDSITHCGKVNNSRHTTTEL